MSSSKNSDSRSSSNAAAEALRDVLLGIADAMRTWTDDDLAAFVAGDRELSFRAPARPASQRKRPAEAVQAEVERVRRDLGEMNTREAGVEYLEKMALSRDALRALVGALDLPLNHSDNMERLRNRVVEALIGYRLRSEAIRGTAPPGTRVERPDREAK